MWPWASACETGSRGWQMNHYEEKEQQQDLEKVEEYLREYLRFSRIWRSQRGKGFGRVSF